MTAFKWIVVVLVGVPIALLLAGQFGLLHGTAPADLGVHDGKLKAPSDTANSVSSQADRWPGHAQQAYARIAPLALIRGGPDDTMARLRAVCQAIPGAEIVTSKSDYLYVRFSTRLLKFVDDTEFWFDPKAQVIQVRSASRLGRKDFGVNRARIEAIRARLLAGN